MADDFVISEGNKHANNTRQDVCSSPGSKGVACRESGAVNVGGPIRSQKEFEYQPTSIKARELRWRKLKDRDSDDA